MRATVFLLAAGLVLVSTPFPEALGAPQQDYLVVPGQRVGLWELGRPLGAYQLGNPRASWKWNDPATRIPIADGYNYLAGPSGPSVNIHTCKDHPRAIQILIHRWTTLPPDIESEAFRFKTADGIGIGSDEADIMRVHGRPTHTIEWTERHDTMDISAVGYTYLPPGLVFHINRGNKKVFALGAEMIDAWAECYLAVLGGRAATRRQDLTMPGPSGVSVPRNLRIVSPTSDIPPQFAGMSGIWIGRNKYGGIHFLVVEQIMLDPPRAVLVAGWGGSRPIWRRSVGRFTSEGLVVYWSDRLYDRYRLVAQDRLEALLEDRGEPEHSHFFLMSPVRN